jgi:hypothetical protein
MSEIKKFMKNNNNNDTNNSYTLSFSYSTNPEKEFTNSKNKISFEKVSPLPKPDFTTLEKKEASFTYKKHGSYKKPKTAVPESPMKSPVQKYFTPKPNSNLLTSNKSAQTVVCRKLNFGAFENNSEENINIQKQLTFAKQLSTNSEDFYDNLKLKAKNNSFLDKLEEEEREYILEETSPIIIGKKTNNLMDKMISLEKVMDVDSINEMKNNITDDEGTDLAYENSLSIKKSLFSNNNSYNNNDDVEMEYERKENQGKFFFFNFF